MTYYFEAIMDSTRFEGHFLPKAAMDYRLENKIRNLIGPLPAEFLPSIIHIDPGPKAKLRDFIRLPTGNLVSEKFKQFLEALEPDIHYFYPIELIRKKGELHQKHYFFLPGQRIECIFPDGEPGLELIWEYSENFPKEKKIPSISGHAQSRTARLSLPAVAGKHLWMPDRCGSGIFVSEEFKQKFKEAKLLGARFRACEDDAREYNREVVLKDILAHGRKYKMWD